MGQELFPVAMENDAVLPDHDLISASISKVDDADAYVGMISYRYGQTPEDGNRNPDKLSLTELEFRRALCGLAREGVRRRTSRLRPARIAVGRIRCDCAQVL